MFNISIRFTPRLLFSFVTFVILFKPSKSLLVVDFLRCQLERGRCAKLPDSTVDLSVSYSCASWCFIYFKDVFLGAFRF